MASSGLRIGSFAGAAIVIEPAFLLLAAYVVGSSVLRQGFGALPDALIFVGVIFAAVLIHELGHAMMAAALRIPSKRIVLTFFGGYVQFARRPEKRWHEMAVSAAGPGANLASYVLMLSMAPLLVGALAPTPETSQFLGALQTFAYVSLVLGLFNLLPGFPLDGGHILRAALSYVVRETTARIATALVGLLLAAAILIWALSQGFMWSAFISLFLGLAAFAELTAARRARQGDSDTTSKA